MAGAGGLGETLIALAPGFELSRAGRAVAGRECGAARGRGGGAGAKGAGAVLGARLPRGRWWWPRRPSPRGRWRGTGAGGGGGAGGEGARALAPLPLWALEGPARAAFAALGLTTLGEVAALPVGAVTARGGAVGCGRTRAAGAGTTRPSSPRRWRRCWRSGWRWTSRPSRFEPLQFALKTVLDRTARAAGGRRRAAVRLRFDAAAGPGRQGGAAADARAAQRAGAAAAGSRAAPLSRTCGWSGRWRG